MRVGVIVGRTLLKSAGRVVSPATAAANDGANVGVVVCSGVTAVRPFADGASRPALPAARLVGRVRGAGRGLIGRVADLMGGVVRKAVLGQVAKSRRGLVAGERLPVRSVRVALGSETAAVVVGQRCMATFAGGCRCEIAATACA